MESTMLARKFEEISSAAMRRCTALDRVGQFDKAEHWFAVSMKYSKKAQTVRRQEAKIISLKMLTSVPEYGIISTESGIT